MRLAPGNSGGPLANARGEVIGVNTMVAGRLALAIPSNTVNDFLALGSSTAWLGVTVRAVRVPHAFAQREVFGLIVLEVEPGSPAEYASLLPGDILLGAEEKNFAGVEDLARVLQGSKARIVRFEFFRGDYSKPRHVAVQLGTAASARSPVAA